MENATNVVELSSKQKKNQQLQNVKDNTLKVIDTANKVASKKLTFFSATLRPVRGAFGKWTNDEFIEAWGIPDNLCSYHIDPNADPDDEPALYFDEDATDENGLPLSYDPDAEIILELMTRYYKKYKNRNGNSLPEITYGLAITHDRDIVNLRDSMESPALYDEYLNGKLKTTHVHVLVKLEKQVVLSTFREAVGQTIYTRTVGAEEFAIDPIVFYTVGKQGRFEEFNSIVYLSHSNAPEKFQYPLNEVCSYKGKSPIDYTAYIEGHWDNIADRRRQKEKEFRNMNGGYEQLLEKLSNGTVSDILEVYGNDAYAKLIADNEVKDITGALQHGVMVNRAKTVADFRKSFFRLNLHIMGASGAGKSEFNKNVAKRLEALGQKEYLHGRAWSEYEAGEDNPVDDYTGQAILNIDDLRYDTFTSKGLLDMLDNTSMKFGKARYKNIMFTQRVTTISTMVEPLRVYPFMKGNNAKNNDEAMDQFFKRLNYVIILLHGDKVFEELDGMFNDNRPKYLEKHVPFGKPIEKTGAYAFEKYLKEKDVKGNGETWASHALVFPIKYNPKGLEIEYSKDVKSEDGEKISQTLKYYPTDGMLMTSEEAEIFYTNEILKSNTLDENGNVKNGNVKEQVGNDSEYFGLRDI